MKNFFAASFLFALVLHGQAHVSVFRGENEQSSFAVEEIPGEPRIRHPLPVPNEALEELRRDETVNSCLAENPLKSGKSLSSWFLASEIHLDGSNEADLVVVPRFLGQEGMCFQTPTGVGLFWIFRKNDGRYELVLRTWGGSLEVLAAKTSGYRKVKTGTLGQAGRNLTDITFHFDGARYIADRERTQKQR
jgi:hypothetical protein